MRNIAKSVCLVVRAVHRDSTVKDLETRGRAHLIERDEMRFAGKTGGTWSVEPFGIVLGDERRTVCRVDTEALNKLRNLRGGDSLDAVGRDGSNSAQEIENALIQIGAPAVEPLTAALKDKRWRMRGLPFHSPSRWETKLLAYVRQQP
jgi:hypothetical protein